MNMTQTLNNFFAKKTKPQAQINSQTDGAAVERAAVLDLSSKTMSRIASFTLFCFLSQTFASILWANPILPRQHHFHENGYVGLHIVPEFDAANQVRGMRLNISVSDRLYATQTQQNQNNIEDSYTQESKLSVKEVCSTLLTPDFFRGEKSLLSQLPQMNVEIAGIVDDSLKDLFLITTETGDLSITSKGNAKTNRNLYISIMGGVTVQNLRAHGICVQARSLEIRGAGNDITHLDYIKPAGAAEAVMTLQEEGQLQVQHMRLHKTTFNNYGTAIVERMTGNQAVLNNHDVLEGALTGHFSALNNLGIEATYNGKLTANVVTVHNENVMTLLAGSHLRGRTLHIDHKNARFNAQDAHINVTEITNKGHLVLEGASKLSVKTLTNQKGATLTAAGTYKIGTFVNKAVSQKQVGALFSGDGEFDSIDNAGSLETQGVTKIHRRMNDNNTVCGFTNRSGARAKLTKLQVGYGDTHWIINNGYLDLVDVDEHYGPKHLKNNSGATLLVRGGYFTTLENEGRVEVHQLSDFITIRNLAKKDGKKIPVMLFKAEVVTNTLTNAGELYALAYLTYTKKFTNNEGAKARIQGLAYEPASEEITSAYDLENAGALDLTQVDQGYAPKRVQNTVTGSLALHDNQGEWDHAVFKDINSKESAFKRGLIVEHLMNEGLFQYWDGVYKIKDIQNREGATFLTGHTDTNHKNGCLMYGTFSNQGVWESMRGMALRDVTKTGKLRLNGALTVYGSKAVNLSEVLKNDIQAKSITLIGHTFHNPKDQNLKLYWTEGEGQNQQLIAIPLTINVKDFTNAGRIHASSLNLVSDAFKQTDLGGILTEDELNIEVEGDIDNAWGILYGKGKTILKTQGKICVGHWQGIEQQYAHRHGGFSSYQNRYQDARYVSNDIAHIKRKKNGAFIRSDNGLTIIAKDIVSEFGSIISAGNLGEDTCLLLKATNSIYLQACAVQANGKTRFEATKGEITTPPVAGTDEDDEAHWHNKWKERESGPRSSLLVSGDLELVVDDLTVRGSHVGAVGNITNRNGEQLGAQSFGSFKVIPLGLFGHSVTKDLFGN